MAAKDAARSLSLPLSLSWHGQRLRAGKVSVSVNVTWKSQRWWKMQNRDWNCEESVKRGASCEWDEARDDAASWPQKVAASAATHGPQAYGLPIEISRQSLQKFIKHKKATKKRSEARRGEARQSTANVTRERHVLWSKFSNSIRELARRRGALYLGQNSVYGRGLMASFGTSRSPPRSLLLPVPRTLGYLMRTAMCVLGECVCTWLRLLRFYRLKIS